MQRIISFLFLIVFLCPVVCKADVKSQSVQSIIEKAKSGDAEAQYNLGWMYDFGYGVTQDDKKAIEWYTKSAQQSFAKAQFQLGLKYHFGYGVTQEQEDEQAVEWFKKAFACFKKAAQQDDAEAQFLLGSMYHDGYGVTQDDKKAVEWYTKAAQQGYADAQYELGLMYYSGEGVPQDYSKAAECWTKAARQGEANVMTRLFTPLYLGRMYQYGQGVTQDYNKAFKWYKKAVQRGNVEAKYNLGLMYYNGNGVTQDYTIAVEWYTKAAQQGYAKAQLALGMSFYLGQGVIEDYVEAYKWVLLAGKQGYDYSKVSKVKDALQRLMTPAQIAQAQDLAKNFAAKKEEVIHKPGMQARVTKPTSYGTGFFISQNGYVVTAAHVVENAERIKIFNQNTNASAKLVYKDEAIDVAVLKADKTNASFLPITSSSEIKTGDEVFTLGFPQIQIQGIEQKYTEGSINALSGMGGNRKFFQISIPVQPGNSGGPMLNSKGQVVGVIAARLDEIAALANTGSIPQNVNYAIKSSFVLPFLDTLSDFEPHKKEMPNKRTELITEAKKAVVLVICY